MGVCRLLGVSAFEAVRAERRGARRLHDPRPRRLRLRRLPRRPRAFARSIRARHTVGLVDALTEAEVAEPLGDGPSREPGGGDRGLRADGLQAQGLRATRRPTWTACCGSPPCSTARPEPYLATLDGNEQFPDAASVVSLWRRMAGRAAARGGCAPPSPSSSSPSGASGRIRSPCTSWHASAPSSSTRRARAPDAFARARGAGATQAISSKSCKGFYAALLDRAQRRQVGTPRAGGGFMSAEDLTTQAGLSVQHGPRARHADRPASTSSATATTTLDGFSGASDRRGARLSRRPSRPLPREARGRVRLRIEGGAHRAGARSTPPASARPPSPTGRACARRRRWRRGVREVGRSPALVLAAPVRTATATSHATPLRGGGCRLDKPAGRPCARARGACRPPARRPSRTRRPGLRPPVGAPRIGPRSVARRTGREADAVLASVLADRRVGAEGPVPLEACVRACGPTHRIASGSGRRGRPFGPRRRARRSLGRARSLAPPRPALALKPRAARRARRRGRA